MYVINAAQEGGPASCSQVKRTGGLTAQELDLGKLCYQNSVFGVGRCIKGVFLMVWGGVVLALEALDQKALSRREMSNIPGFALK